MTPLDALVICHFGWSDDRPGSKESYAKAREVLAHEATRIYDASKPLPIWAVLRARDGVRIQFFGKREDAEAFASSTPLVTRIVKYIEAD